jgi:hypothetical protein
MKWYSYLKNNGEFTKGSALLDYETYDENNLIVCHKLKYLNFGKFNNYLEFAKYMLKNTPEQNRCFFECIFGDKNQRPYFDIEFYTNPQGVKLKEEDHEFYLKDEEADQSVNCLVNCIFEELAEQTSTENPLKINNSHIMVFTSHSDKDTATNTTRKSYHIIVEGFCVNNHKDNKEFHDRVVKRMPPKWVGIIDHSVYNSLRQMRIYGNMKWQSNRYKILNESLTMNFIKKFGFLSKVEPESDNHKTILILESSLISQTSSCIILNCKAEEKKPLYIKKSSDDEGIDGFNPLTPEEITEALKLCYKYAGLEFGDSRFPYTYLKTVEDNGTSSLVLLRRLRPSTCAICNRKHEHENPYLIVNGENRDVYLDCRRNSENKKLHVGSMGPRPKVNKISEETEEISKKESVITKQKIVIPTQPFDVKNFISSKPASKKMAFSIY